MLKISSMTFAWKSIQFSGSGLALNAAAFKVFTISAKINDISGHQGDISMVSNGCLKSNFSSITLGAIQFLVEAGSANTDCCDSGSSV